MKEALVEGNFLVSLMVCVAHVLTSSDSILLRMSVLIVVNLSSTADLVSIRLTDFSLLRTDFLWNVVGIGELLTPQIRSEQIHADLARNTVNENDFTDMVKCPILLLLVTQVDNEETIDLRFLVL